MGKPTTVVLRLLAGPGRGRGGDNATEGNAEPNRDRWEVNSSRALSLLLRVPLLGSRHPFLSWHNRFRCERINLRERGVESCRGELFCVDL